MTGWRRLAVAVAMVGAVGGGLLIGQLGGSGPARPAAPAVDVVAGGCARTGYGRAKFGNQPSPTTRKAVEFLVANADGSFTDPYTGLTQATAAGLDIDHVVPLGYAWDHGACRWPTSLRVLFATDVHNLALVSLHLNRQKGDQGPGSWLPPVGQCAYWARFTSLAKDYHLTPDPVGFDGHERACPT